MRIISAGCAALLVGVCAVPSNGSVVGFEGSMFGGQLTYNAGGVEVKSWAGPVPLGESLFFRTNGLPDDRMTDVAPPATAEQEWSVESEVVTTRRVGVGRGRAAGQTTNLRFRFWRPRATRIGAGDQVVIDWFGLDDQSATSYRVVGSVTVSLLPPVADPPDPPWPDIVLGLGAGDNSFSQSPGGGLDVQVRLTPSSSPDILPADEISEFFISFAVEPVPEPATMMMIVGGLLLLGNRRWKR